MSTSGSSPRHQGRRATTLCSAISFSITAARISSVIEPMMMAGLASRSASACAINCARPKVSPRAPWRDHDPLRSGAVGRGSDDFVRMRGATTGRRLIGSPSFPLSVVTGCLRAGFRRNRSGRVDSVRTETPCQKSPGHIPGPLVRRVERLRSTFLSSDNPQCSGTGLPLAPILAEALCSSTSGMAQQSP